MNEALDHENIGGMEIKLHDILELKFFNYRN
jgi:hypothetical protein